MTAVRRWALTAVSTWPRLLLVLWAVPEACVTALYALMNPADWVAIGSGGTLAAILALKLPFPEDARARLDQTRREAS